MSTFGYMGLRAAGRVRLSSPRKTAILPCPAPSNWAIEPTHGRASEAPPAARASARGRPADVELAHAMAERAGPHAQLIGGLSPSLGADGRSATIRQVHTMTNAREGWTQALIV